MKTCLAILIFSLAAVAQQGELDRIVAVVNGQVILESEIADEVHWQRLASGGPAGPVTDKDRGQALDRLIDQALIQQQIATTNYVPVTETEVEARLADLRAALGNADTDEKWRALLTQHELSQDAARDRVAAQLNILRFVDLKLRPSVFVDRVEIEKYYQEKFVPEMHSKGAQPPPLNEVTAQIENILAEEQVGKLFEAWLKGVRTQSDIRRVREAELAGEKS